MVIKDVLLEFQVVKYSEVKKIVEKAFHKFKFGGYKKLHKRATHSCAVLSQR